MLQIKKKIDTKKFVLRQTVFTATNSSVKYYSSEA